MLARWPSVAANRATPGRGARSTSAGTTVRTEARALLLMQVRTQQRKVFSHVVRFDLLPVIKQQGFRPSYLLFQVYQPADVRRASQGPPVAVGRVRTTA